MVESEMNQAENAARKRGGKGKRSSGSSEKFAASERLRVLGKHLKEDIKRFREPGTTKTNKVNQDKPQNVEQTLGDSFFKIKQ